MNTHMRIAIAVLFAVGMTGLASPSWSKDSRDVTIGKCLRLAQTQYPIDTGEAQSARTAVYKACMTKAGYKP